MKAIGYSQAGPLTNPEALFEFETEVPAPGPRDLLVEVKGISVNPVDVKVRANALPEGAPRILGFDAAGTVTAVGAEVTLFAPGDEVFYAGDITRPGSNAAYQLVDERIVGLKPENLDFADAAALPLTAITAWEMLFDSFKLKEGDGAGKSLLVIGGAGGVGSILIQLARKLTGLTVIATASRPETRAWVSRMGADHVIDHRKALPDQLAAIGITPDYIASLTNTEEHFPALVEVIRPRGEIAVIDDPQSIDIRALKQKAASFHWEFMFTRSMFETEDMDTQHRLLNRVSSLIEDGTLIPTRNHHSGRLAVETLRQAHALQESGKAIGKTVLDGLGSE